MSPPYLQKHLEASKDSVALSLAYAPVGDEDCQSIAHYIRENVMFKTVDLRGNNISADGLAVLANALSCRRSITSLCLKWNHVGSAERGIRALCDVLKTKSSMSHLDLRSNRIGPECGRLLAEMLKENHTLTHLDLSWNCLGNEGGKALLGGLQQNHALIDCQLGGNMVARDTLHAITAILHRNQQPVPRCTTIFPEDRTGGSARLFGDVAEHIELLERDVSRVKKYGMDAEEREHAMTQALKEREWRVKDLEHLLARAQEEKDELLHDRRKFNNEIAQVVKEKAKAMQDLDRAQVDKTDLEMQISRLKCRQHQLNEENARLRTHLSKCKDDLSLALV